ncbi:MAG: cyclic nucleotide-binding domain-containing protein [Candidatus Latescibacterota bacterium]
MSDPRVEQTIDPEWENLFRPGRSCLPSLEEELAGVRLFSLLTQEELGLLARIVHVRHYAAGEVVLRPGVPQSGFYLVRSGSVQVVDRGTAGREQVLDVLGHGELLGEFALVDDTPRSTAIVAAEPCELIGFFKPDLMAILATRAAMGCKIVLRLAEEMARVLGARYRELVACGWASSLAEAEQGSVEERAVAR